MNSISPCPEAFSLKQFLRGRSPEEETDTIAEHVLTCDACALAIDDLVSDDRLFRVMEEALPGVVGKQDPPAMLGLMERLRQLEPAKSSASIEDAVAQDTDTGAETPLPAISGDADGIDLHSILAPAQAPGELGRLAHYRIFRLLGRGGMGMVYEAEDTQLRRLVAVKVMKPALARDPVARQRFLREARAAAAIKHDHIVTIHQVVEEGEIPLLVMELLEGASLESWLTDRPRPPLAEIVRMACGMADGLSAAHERGLIHRDVKPDNLWVEPSGRIKLLDFGLARATGGFKPSADDAELENACQRRGVEEGFASLTQAGAIAGTPRLICLPNKRLELPWMPGAIFSAWVASSIGCAPPAHPPFLGKNASKLVNAVLTKTPSPLADRALDLPSSLVDLVHRLLAKRPEDRPQSAKDVQETLQAIRRDLAQAQEVGLRRRLRRRVLMLVTLCALATGAAVWALVPNARYSESNAPVEFDEQCWRQDVAALPALQQIDAVRGRLRELNPGFDGNLSQVIEDGQVVELQCNSADVVDVGPLRALQTLKRLILVGTPARQGRLTDLSPLHGLNLVSLSCSWTHVNDLTPLRDMQLNELHASFTLVTDLSPLRGQRLDTFSCRAAPIATLAPLEGQPLKELWFDFRRERDLATLRKLPTLVHINGIEAPEFWRQEDEYSARCDAFARRVAELAPSAQAQAQAIADRLREANPGFDGKVTHQIEGGLVTGLEFNTNQITDLTPVRALSGLRQLSCKGTPQRQGKLDNLWPLRGLALTRLDCGDNKVIDLEPLRGMPLKWLRCSATDVSDLGPLSAAPLEHLECPYTEVRDLEPLRACPLTFLAFHGTRVADLSVLRDKRLAFLNFKQTIVSDLTPIQGLPVQDLICDIVPKRDLAVLKSMPALEKLNGKPVAVVLAEAEQGLRKQP